MTGGGYVPGAHYANGVLVSDATNAPISNTNSGNYASAPYPSSIDTGFVPNTPATGVRGGEVGGSGGGNIGSEPGYQPGTTVFVSTPEGTVAVNVPTGATDAEAARLAEVARAETIRQQAQQQQQQTESSRQQNLGAVTSQSNVRTGAYNSVTGMYEQPNNKDYFAGTQFERGHIPTAEELKVREEQARNLSLFGVTYIPRASQVTGGLTAEQAKVIGENEVKIDKAAKVYSGKYNVIDMTGGQSLKFEDELDKFVKENYVPTTKSFINEQGDKVTVTSYDWRPDLTYSILPAVTAKSEVVEPYGVTLLKTADRVAELSLDVLQHPEKYQGKEGLKSEGKINWDNTVILGDAGPNTVLYDVKKDTTINVPSQRFEADVARSTGGVTSVSSLLFEVPINAAVQTYTATNELLRDYVTHPFAAGIEKATGINIESPLIYSLMTPSIIGIGPFGVQEPQSVKDAYGGFNAGIVRDVIENPAKQLLTVGAGYGLGLAFEGTSYALSKIPDISIKTINALVELGPEASIPVGEIATTAFKIGATGYGLATAGTSLATQLATAQTAAERGSVLGVAAKDAVLLGLGFLEGEKGFRTIKGEIKNVGKQVVEIEQGVYPQMPIKDQLKAFQNNVLEGISYEKLDKMQVAKEYAEFNLANQLSLKEASKYPTQHAYEHLKNVAINTQKIIDAYPELQPYLIEEYGSLAKAKAEISKGGFLHDLLKVTSSSQNEYFGMGHGEILYELYRTGNLPEGIKLAPEVAKAIKMHEVAFPKVATPEFQILATADRLEFQRFSQGVNKDLLPLKDAIERLNKLDANKIYEVPKIDFEKDTADFLNKYNIGGGKIYPKGAKPVMIHTTGNKFYDDVIHLENIPSTAEFKVLYGSTKLSTPFTGLKGASEMKFEIPKSIAEFEKSVARFLEGAFGSYKEPAVAALMPEQFIEGKPKFSSTPTFEGQRIVPGKGYPYLSTPAIPGTAEVLMVKNEIEAGIREELGTFVVTKRLATKVHGVKIPLDVLEYSAAEEAMIKNLNEVSKNIGKDVKLSPKVEKFEPSKYISPEEPTIYSTTSSSLGLSRSVESEISSFKKSMSSAESSYSETKSLESSKSTDITSGINSLGSSIASEISSINSSITSGLSGSGSSPKPSKAFGSSTGYPTGGSGGGSGGGSSTGYPPIIPIPQSTTENKYFGMLKKNVTAKPKNLGKGYDVYGKALKSNKFFKINSHPITHDRAKDIGSYYVRETLARTFRIKPSGEAQPDYEFLYIPEGFFKSVAGKLREYKIRQRQQISTPEQFIEKAVYSLDTPAEKEQLRKFRQQVRNTLG